MLKKRTKLQITRRSRSSWDASATSDEELIPEEFSFQQKEQTI